MHFASSISEQLAQDQALVHAGHLHPKNACWFESPEKPRGLVICLHGWSAGSWQFREIAPRLLEAGLALYAVRLPGHGSVTDSLHETPRFLPKASESKRYHRFAMAIHQQAWTYAQQHDIPLYVFGFSAGGALALDMASHHPHSIARVLCVSPLLRLHATYAHVLTAMLDYANAFHVLSPVLDRIQQRWNLNDRLEKMSWRAGHSEFSLGNVYSLTHYAHQVARKYVATPTQFVVSWSDTMIHVPSVISFYKNLGANQKHGLYAFERKLELPHALLTQNENPNMQAREQLYHIAEQFLVEGRFTESKH